MSGVWIHMAATSMITQRLASDFVINPLISLCSYISIPLSCLAPTASCAANMHNKEEWNAGITNMTVHEEDVHDRDPVRQGPVSASPFTPSAVACESLASLCLPTALTHGRFASSLCLCLCLCLCLFLCLFLCLCRCLSEASEAHIKTMSCDAMRKEEPTDNGRSWQCAPSALLTLCGWRRR